MTKQQKPLSDCVPGDTVHVLRSGIMIRPRMIDPDDFVGAFSAPSEVLTRGKSLTLTQKLIEANDWLLDEDAQTSRWGEIAIGTGPFPEDLSAAMPGTPEAEMAFKRAHEVAWAQPDPGVRQKMLADARRRYGAQATSRTLQNIRGDDGQWR